MPQRYVITSRQFEGDLDLPEGQGIEVVAKLDRGLLVEMEPDVAAAIAGPDLRVKELPEPGTIRLFSYEIETDEAATPNVPGAFALSEDEPEDEAEEQNHLIQLVGPVQESWLTTLAERDIRPIESVGPYAYFVRATAKAAAGLSALPFVAWTGPLLPAYKVNPVLLTDEAENLGLDASEDDAPDGDDLEEDDLERGDDPDRSGGGLGDDDGGLGPIEAVDIGVLADADVERVAEIVAQLGGTVQAVAPDSGDVFRSITAVVTPELLPRIAALASVRWIDAIRTPKPESERSVQIAYEDLDAQAAPNTAPITGYQANLAALGVDGSGTTIAICDTGIDSNDPTTVHDDLAGRLAFAVNGNGTASTSQDTNGHGTHVAGIAAGNGATGDTDPEGFVLGQGVASGSQVGSIRSNGTRQARIQTAVQNGAEVMNNSYALDGNVYGAGDRAFDLGVRDGDPSSAGNRPLTVIFSAGNSGSGSGSCTKAMKNAIIVGNSLNSRPGEGDIDDIRGLRTSSSRGPAADGRLQPHLCAPGTNIVSARSSASTDNAYIDTDDNIHSDHTSSSGTSMAAPVVAGACALIIDWWRQTRGGATPSPALLKAMLVVSAESMAGGPARNGSTIAAGPNNDVGWGRISLENTFLQAPASDRGPKIFLDQRHAFTATGQEYRLRVAAADPSRPLRIALAWTDAPGTVGATQALVNDLDLEVVENATGDLFLGNVFDGGFSTTGGTADSLNNLECVYIENPTGTYDISIDAANIAASARTDIATPWQDFAFVIDNAVVPSADPVDVVTVLDRSGSMEASGYVDVTRQTSSQFIDLLSLDDSIGVVSFGDDAIAEFDDGGSTAAIEDVAVRTAATQAVDGIGFGGCTFMGDGIERAGDLLASSTGRRAMVLVSDGYDNKGCDADNPTKPSAIDAAAALPADLPIFSCALGPASDQTLLAQLADDTDGRYYYMPTGDDLFEIYNYIRGQVSGDGVIVNQTSAASRSTVAGFVDACAESVTFTVAWHNRKLRYVPREPSRTTEISVRLRSPSGRWIPHSATEVTRVAGEAYVSLSIHDPRPGRWTVEVTTTRDDHTPYTVGGFVRSDIGLQVTAPNQVVVGQPIELETMVGDGRRPVTGLRVRTTATVPRFDIDELLGEFKDTLARKRLPRPFYRDGDPDERAVRLAKLVRLRDELLDTSEDDLLPVGRISLTMKSQRPVPSWRDRLAGRRIPWSTVDWAELAMVENGALDVGRGVPARAGAGLTVVADERGDRFAVEPASALATALRPGPAGSIIDRRDVLRPRRSDLSIGRLADTTLPGSYNFLVTASGYSSSCRTRFVRRQLVSVAVTRPEG